MEELLAWLKDTRLLLASHLPDDFDALQGELRKCEVRSACLLFSLYVTHLNKIGRMSVIFKIELLVPLERA